MTSGDTIPVKYRISRRYDSLGGDTIVFDGDKIVSTIVSPVKHGDTIVGDGDTIFF